MQNRFADAASSYRRALHIYQNWYENEDPKTVESLLCLGQALASEHQYDATRKILNKGVTIGAQVLGDKNRLMLFALNVLGTLEQRTQHFNAAKNDFERRLACSIWIAQCSCCYRNEQLRHAQ